jgi:predicted MFS family arabinose efflux permease
MPIEGTEGLSGLTGPPEPQVVPAEGEPSTAHQRGYGWYVASICFVIYALNFLDRQVINILGQAIKTSLGLSDTQLGLLNGTAFALFYSALGLPIARLADRLHRVNIISVSLLLWSALTAACGAAANYLQLFLLRIGVGVGEAGGTPPSQSLISDYVSDDRRTLAFAIFNSGPAVGGFLGYLLGGYVGQAFGWRWAFLIAALPGILAVLLFKLTVKEPIRGAADGLEREALRTPPLAETVRALMARPSYVWLVIAATFGIFLVYVTGAWLPPLFIRIHGFGLRQTGEWMALGAALGGLLGSLGGGAVAARLRRRWARGDLWLVAVCSLLACPALLVTVLARSAAVALAAMLLFSVFVWVWIAPTSARIQSVVPVRARALAVGFMLFFSNATALAFGPTLVGMGSDALRASMGNEGLAVALAWASSAGILSAVLFLVAGRYLMQDLRASKN